MKTRIFVTNALNFLPQTDRVMLIENGQLLGKVDNYDNQLENNPVFREFLREYLDSVEKNAKNVQEGTISQKHSYDIAFNLFDV